MIYSGIKIKEDSGINYVLNYCSSNIYWSNSFHIDRAGRICFGELMRSSSMRDVHNTGQVSVLIHKYYNIYMPGTFTVHYFDNKLYFTLDEVREILDIVNQNIQCFNYNIEECGDDYIINFDFTDATHAEILFVLNITRRFYRFLLAVVLRIAYNIWKSNKYNLSLIDLIILIDNLNVWSMSDDLFVIHTDEILNFHERIFNTDTLRTYNPVRIHRCIESSVCSYYPHNEIMSMFKNNSSRIDSVQLDRSIRRNVLSKFYKYPTPKDVYNAYVKYISFFIKNKIKEYKQSNLVD